MSSPIYRFIEPLDVLLLRGNRSFGAPGSHGESLMPPWPSVAAGAIRSRILTDDGIDLTAFARNEVTHDSLGTPDNPGSFVLHAFHVARRVGSQLEMLVAPPANLFISADDNDKVSVQELTPVTPSQAIATSSPLPKLPVLALDARSKAASGWWLRQSGWQKFLQGQTPGSDDLIKVGELWATDERVGVGLASRTRSADDGKLFTTCAIAPKPGVGFVTAIGGAAVPDRGLLRLGGDGRAASIDAADITWPEPDYDAIATQGRCRVVLTSPGLFTQGWLPNGIRTDEDGHLQFDLHGVKGRLVAACVSRSEIVSGWDLANRRPKPAERVAPTGSVYWLENLDATPSSLRKLVECGLWGTVCEDMARRAEGFNRLAVANWHNGNPS